MADQMDFAFPLPSEPADEYIEQLLREFEEIDFLAAGGAPVILVIEVATPHPSVSRN